MTERGSRKTYIPFSPDDAVAIRQMVATPDTRVPCPRCGADLTIGTPISVGGTIMPLWDVRCEGCRRHLFVRDLPAHR